MSRAGSGYIPHFHNRRCPVSDCKMGLRRSSLVMCHACWEQVPKEIKAEVARTWELMRNDERHDFEVVCRWAVEAVEEKNAHKRAGRERSKRRLAG